jgi:type VI secretion system secreted protein Hcp
MAKDAFLKIKEIPGESTDAAHKGWIEIDSFSSGVSQMAGSDRSAGGVGAGGKAQFQDISIAKQVEKSSPKLQAFCADAKTIPMVEIHFCRATGKKTVYLEYKLTDAIISSMSVSGGGGVPPSESIAFNFGKIEMTYTETDHKTGAAKGKVASWWDLTENKGG